jgi:hypothetical protein
VWADEQEKTTRLRLQESASMRHTAREMAAVGMLTLTACVPVAFMLGVGVAIAVVLLLFVGLAACCTDSTPQMENLSAAEFADGPVHPPAHVTNHSGILEGTSLLMGAMATFALGAQLLCAAERTQGLIHCVQVCSLAFAAPPDPCTNARSGIVNISEINNAAIGVTYHPEAYASLQHRQGLVYVRTETSLNSDLDSSSLIALVGHAAPRQERDLVRSLYAANERSLPVELARRNFADEIPLDSTEAEGYLAATTLSEVPLAVRSTLHTVSPGEIVPGVISLSRPGVDSSLSMAIVVVVIQSPQSLSSDQVEKRTLLLLRRRGNSWQVSNEWLLDIRRR